jgi:lysophospholipase L1-like esterase
VLSRDRLSLALAASLAALLAVEGAFRLLEGRLGVDRGRLERFRDFVWTGGETAHYVPRAHVLYTRRPNDPEVNSLGFLGDEFPVEKRPGVLRIACIGSSTTEGGNGEGRRGSYPYLLGVLLASRIDRPVETLNFGVSGWTTAEEMVNYFLVVQDYSPDLVLIHEAVNDYDPRTWPGFRTDYSHYRQPWKAPGYSLPFRLLVRWSDAFAFYELRTEGLGLPVVVVRPPQGPQRLEPSPQTALAFRRNIRTMAEHVRLRGGVPVLVTMPCDSRADATFVHYRAAIDEHNQILRDLAREHGFALVDLDARARARPDGLHSAFLDIVHMTPEGNRFKAEAIADTLIAEGLVR